MDKAGALRAMNQELEALARRRRRYLEDAEDCALKMGATTTYLREVLGQPKSTSAEIAGLSPSYMTELMSKAAVAGTRIDDPLKRIPLLEEGDVSPFLAQHGGLARVVSSFADAADTMYMAGLSPLQLVREGSLLRGSLLVEAADGEWAAVDNVTVGYLGTGPSNTYRMLMGLGLDEALAKRISHSRVSDVSFDGGPNPVGVPMHSDRWPHVGLSTPVLHGDRWVVPFGIDGLRSPTDVDEETFGGFYAANDPTPYLHRWLKWLADPDEWAAGPRNARVYLSENAASDDGFTQRDLKPHDWDYAIYTVIIEQGSLQLWLSLPQSTDPTVQFTPETYEVLRAAGFYVADLEGQDARNAFWRWLTNLGRTRPSFVDLGGPISTGGTTQVA